LLASTFIAERPPTAAPAMTATAILIIINLPTLRDGIVVMAVSN
jgi:hypothetical protein